MNFKNQCIICRKKIKFIVETVEENENENEELEEFNLVNETNELFNSNQLIVVNQTNVILFKNLCIGSIIIFNFYTVFNLLYFLKN